MITAGAVVLTVVENYRVPTGDLGLTEPGGQFPTTGGAATPEVPGLNPAPDA
jgi:hypothetical protein